MARSSSPSHLAAQNVHFHTLVLDGVFAEGADGALEFHAAEPPSDEEVARLLATIYRRVRRLLARRGLEVDHVPDVDPLAEESPALAGISSASIHDLRWREPVPNHENGFSRISGIGALAGSR